MELISIKKIKTNPNNPRIIKDGSFKKLVQSIIDFPEMLDIRPIVINKNNIIIGGNMRYKAAIEAGLTEVPIIKVNLSDKKEKEFIIKDNVSGGDWDFEMLANEWDVEQLEDWGLDVPNFDSPEPIEESGYDLSQKWFLNIEFEDETNCEKWYNKLIEEGLICKIVQ